MSQMFSHHTSKTESRLVYWIGVNIKQNTHYEEH